MAFVKTKFFNDEDYDLYLDEQVNSQRIKLDKKRDHNEYDWVSDRLKTVIEYPPKNRKMLCMGSRNGWEKSCFKKNFESFDIKDLDIIPESGCDYIQDFNSLPEDWESSWDVIYTNAPDHVIDGESAFLEWVRVLNQSGILIVGWSIHNTTEPESKQWSSSIDCTLYGSLDEIRNWICQIPSIEIIDYFGPFFEDDHKVNTSFNYYMIRKT